MNPSQMTFRHLECSFFFFIYTYVAFALLQDLFSHAYQSVKNTLVKHFFTVKSGVAIVVACTASLFFGEMMCY